MPRWGWTPRPRVPLPRPTSRRCTEWTRPTQLLFPIVMTCTLPKAVCCFTEGTHLSPKLPALFSPPAKNHHCSFLCTIPMSYFPPLSEKQTTSPVQESKARKLAAGFFQHGRTQCSSSCFPPTKQWKRKEALYLTRSLISSRESNIEYWASSSRASSETSFNPEPASESSSKFELRIEAVCYFNHKVSSQ